MKAIVRGVKVIWESNNKVVEGEVVDTFLQNGANVSENSAMHNAASKNALLIELRDGSKVLKLEDEVNLPQ